MKNRKQKYIIVRLLLTVILSSLIVLVGCGSSMDNTPAPIIPSIPTSSLKFASPDSSNDKVVAALIAAGATVENTSSTNSTHSGVILDCNIRSLQEVINFPGIREYLYKGLVLIDPTPEVKRGLTTLIGFAGFINESSDAYFIKAVPGKEGNEYIIYDYPVAFAVNAEDYYTLLKMIQTQIHLKITPVMVQMSLTLLLFRLNRINFFKT